MTEPQWIHDAVGYEVYVRSFSDSDGDGLGDLDGVRQRLDHLVALGVDVLWLTPIYPSPDADHGYDVADYRSVRDDYQPAAPKWRFGSSQCRTGVPTSGAISSVIDPAVDAEGDAGRCDLMHAGIARASWTARPR